MKTGGMSKNAYFSRVVGEVDEESVRLGRGYGINVAGGCVNKLDGRVRLSLRRTNIPVAKSQGYALRSRVVWWLNTGEVLDIGDDLHHKNHDRTDDRFENLEKLEHGKHSSLHNPQEWDVRVCSFCGGKFRVKKHRPTKFCSLGCYHQKPREASHGLAIARGLKRAYAEGRR